jgi:hypothetical protein
MRITALLTCLLPVCWGLWLSGLVAAQEQGATLADLARQSRERKRLAVAPAPVIQSLNYAIQCRDDWNCFLAALEERRRAQLRIPDTIDLSEVSGLSIASDVLLEIHDCREKTCQLTGRTENSTVRINDGQRARLLMHGWTAAEIDERERAAQSAVQPQDEARVNCVFRIDRLRFFFERRRQGTTSGKDWELADRCEGLDQTVTNPLDPPKP